MNLICFSQWRSLCFYLFVVCMCFSRKSLWRFFFFFFFAVTRTRVAIIVLLSTSCPRSLLISSPTASSPSLCFQPSPTTWWVNIYLHTVQAHGGAGTWTPCHCMSRSSGKTPRCSRWRPCNDYCACCYLGLSTSKAKKQPITVLRNEKSRLQASAWFQRPDLWSHFISFDVIAIIDPGSRKLLRATLGGDGGGDVLTTPRPSYSRVPTSLAGLKPAFEAFLCFALTMSLVSLAGVGLAFLVSASVSSFAMANILIALPFVFMMVRRENTHAAYCTSHLHTPHCYRGNV